MARARWLYLLRYLRAANRCWSALTMASEDEELGRLIGTLEAGAIPIDHVCAELGPGCLEIATAPEPAVRAADSAALAKVYTKVHFARAGRRSGCCFSKSSRMLRADWKACSASRRLPRLPRRGAPSSLPVTI